jgi:trehalose 6-phosphate synthase/phosphatase
MLALYTACDIALITPLRDGMNLVAKEFVASRKDKRGVLLLSEMTGAARELTSAIHLNPNDVEEIAANILLGFEMPAAEQEQRMEAMQARISNYNVNTWAADFTAQLDIVKTKQKEFQVRFIDTRDQRKMVSGYLAAKKRLFLLDYDGTLADFSNSPEKVKPGGHVRGLLSALAQDPFNEVYLVSGRKGEFLEKWFGDLPVHLVSEHGAKIRMANGHWQTLVQPRNEWKPQVMGVMEQYVKRCANTFVEEKDYCMVWHYRKADSEQVKLRVRELVAELQEYARSLGLQVVMGSKIVEVRVTGADKGTITRNHILPGKWDFIFAAGDDKTDEDMFRVLCGITYAFTVKIGPEASFARYNLLTPLSLVSLLESLVRSADDHSPVTQMRHTLQEEEPSANNA